MRIKVGKCKYEIVEAYGASWEKLTVPTIFGEFAYYKPINKFFDSEWTDHHPTATEAKMADEQFKRRFFGGN